MNIEKPLASSLAMLGYNPAWLEWGLLSEATLQQQIAHYQTGQDKNTEHYRYSAFRLILSSRFALTKAEVEQYIAVAHMDEDQFMAQAALADLITWSGLTSEQFDRLSHHPHFAAPLFQKLALRRRLLTELASNSVVSAKTFGECLVSRDAEVQRKLVSHCELTPEQLQVLVGQGANRAIQNIARTLGVERGL